MNTVNHTPPVSPEFSERLNRVQKAVNERLGTLKSAQHNATRARLWVRWMGQNLLSDNTTGGAT